MSKQLLYEKVYKEFVTEPNDKANLITEAFGIDGGHKNVVVDIEVPKHYEVMYITGESGSGKSTILNELKSYEPSSIPGVPLFEWHKDTNTALKILTLVGLGDAVLYLATYDELSDSQQARARIAIELLKDKDEIIIDEFLSTLDRETAKSVAYCIQKAVRNLGKKAIFVTAHDDLKDYLKADVVIEGKSFPSRWKVSTPVYDRENPVLDKCRFHYEDKVFYRNLRLGELHYRGKYTGGTKEYLAVTLKERVIGILVSTYRRHDGGRRISRVVIHPSYRGVGVGTELIKEYLKKYPGSDVVATMALFNPVFEKAGMTRVDDSVANPPPYFKKGLIDLGFNVDSWHSKRNCNSFVKLRKNREFVGGFSKYASHLVQPGGKSLSTKEIKTKIIEDEVTASRVLWGLRPRTMAKYVDK